MRFCPDCGARLSSGSGETAACPKCGKQVRGGAEKARRQEVLKKPSGSDASLKVMDEESVETLPTISITCPSCDNNEAVWWMLQTRSADEATTQFFRCTKCNHTWRNYS